MPLQHIHQFIISSINNFHIIAVGYHHNIIGGFTFWVFDIDDLVVEAHEDFFDFGGFVEGEEGDVLFVWDEEEFVVRG